VTSFLVSLRPLFRYVCDTQNVMARTPPGPKESFLSPSFFFSSPDYFTPSLCPSSPFVGCLFHFLVRSPLSPLSRRYVILEHAHEEDLVWSAFLPSLLFLVCLQARSSADVSSPSPRTPRSFFDRRWAPSAGRAACKLNSASM